MLVWQLSVLLACVALISAWHYVDDYRVLARAQDERLLAALSLLVQRGPAAVAALPPGMLQRISNSGGDQVLGDQALPRFPFADPLANAEQSALYVTHRQGQLHRAAGRARTTDSKEVQLIQVAEALSRRWPGWNSDWRAGLVPLYQAALLIALGSVAGVGILRRWLARAQAAGMTHDDAAADENLPAELQPIIERARRLGREQQAWVDEQRRFVADASHQLRTPMAVLRTQLQSAIAGDVPVNEVLPQMLHTVDRAAGLANQLLSLTKLEQLKRQGDLPVVDVRDVARDAVLELSPLIAVKRLDFALADGSFAVPADAQMLGELLRNLLANAIHHAPERARVGIILRDGHGVKELIVWDEGPGIDEAVRPRLFHSFAASRGGVGLGLSICRQIAEAMDADVMLHNRCDGGHVVGVDAVVTWGQGP